MQLVIKKFLSEPPKKVERVGVQGLGFRAFLIKKLRVQVRGSFEEFLFWIFFNHFKLQGLEGLGV